MNPYNVLGINQNADKETIRKAYLTQSMKWHPDKNLQNIEEATIKFKEINEAYEKISSIDNIDSIIDSFFGFINKKIGKENQSSNILIDVNVTLENLYCGTECLINYNRNVIDESVKNEFCKDCIKHSLKNVRTERPQCAFCRAEINNMELSSQAIRDEFNDLLNM